MAYSKLHSSLINSSLWSEPDHVRLLFITLLAMCDKDGCVYGSKNGLERAANLNADDFDECDPWAVLQSPDQDSCDRMRAPENEGRRIEEIPGGFRLLNFSYYRGLRNDDDRSEQNRRAQAKWRVSQGKPASASVSLNKPQKAHTEAETEAEAGVSKRSTSSHPSPSAPRNESVEVVVAHYVSKRPRCRPGRKERALILQRLMADKFTVDELKEAIDGCLAKPYTSPAGKTFDGLELIVRDSAKVNQYRGQTKDSTAADRVAAVMKSLKEDEARYARK